jgi:hypothetical protein
MTAGCSSFAWARSPCCRAISSAKLDPSGRLAVLGGFVSKAGLATGPLAAGFILSRGHFDYLIWLAIAMLALSAVAALFAASQVDQLE